MDTEYDLCTLELKQEELEDEKKLLVEDIKVQIDSEQGLEPYSVLGITRDVKSEDAEADVTLEDPLRQDIPHSSVAVSHGQGQEQTVTQSSSSNVEQRQLQPNQASSSSQGKTSKKKKPGRKACEILKCDLCPDLEFPKITPLLNHMLTVHENPSCKKSHRCHRCSKKYATKYMYKRHKELHRVTGRPLSCPVCEMRFRKYDKDQFKRHVSFAHTAHTCEVCKMNFELNIQLRQHERAEHPEIFIHACMICDKTYSVESFLETHLNTHVDEGPYFCYACPTGSVNVRTFKTKPALLSHLHRHTGETCVTNNQCKVCLQCFTCKTSLKAHVTNVHEKEKLLACIYCAQRFSSKYHRHLHLKSHQNKDGKYDCPTCSKSFSEIGKVSIHFRGVHTRSQRSECKVCGKLIKTSRMTEHMDRHSKKFSLMCYFCSKSLSRKEALIIHLYLHTREKTYKCAICCKRFLSWRVHRRHSSICTVSPTS